MKLKELNDELEKVIDSTMNELTSNYSKKTGETYKFEFWSDTRHYDLDKNLCYNAVVDVRKIVDEKVISFKRVYDRMLVQRENIGTVEEPKYGKQQNVEELRNTVFREIISKSVGGLVLGLAAQTKEQIQELYKEADDLQ